MPIHNALRAICVVNPYLLWISSSSYVMPNIIIQRLILSFSAPINSAEVCYQLCQQ